MAKKKNNNNKKLPWSIPLEAREDLYNGINPSADFGIGSFLSQGIGYLGGFRTGLSMNEDEARWAAYLGLPYDKEYAPDTKIRFEHDKDYPDRQYQGVSKRAKNEIRKEVIPEAKRIKDEYGKEWIQVLDERGIFGNDSTIYHPRETYTGDLGKFGIREVGNSGIYEIGDKYDFPSWVPVPDRNEGTELMIRDTIWSDRANPKLYNQEVIKRKNKHDIGGFLSNIGSKLDGWNTNLTDKFLDSGIGKGLSSFGIKAGGLGGIANTAATAIGGALAGGRTSGVGNAMQKIGSLASNIPGVGGFIGAGVNLIGGGINALLGSKLNAENIAAVEGDINQALNFTSNVGDYDALASNYAGLQGVRGFNQDFIGKDGWIGGSKAKRKFNSLKTQAEEAEAHQLLALANNAQNIANTNLQLLEANYNAYGGPINMKYTGTMSPFGNQFDEGGHKESGIPTQEEYIAQQIAAKRAAALDKSRNRTSVRVPMIPNQTPIDVWEDLLNNDIKYTEEDLSRAMAEGNKELAVLKQQELDWYLKKKDAGYPKLVPGANCMYNAGDCYDLNIPGNQTFVAKHKELGFKKAPKGSMEPGDIVQDVRGGTPIHAMIYDSKDNKGNLLFNYANGRTNDSAFDINENYVKQGKYRIPIKDYDVYKYVGTPADSTQWINEYKEMYNKKAEGGNLFTNGVTIIGNGGTHQENPLEGVPMGVDNQGIPNLVEEDEVIYDDYVFSNRLRVPKEVRQKYKLRGVTFADAAKQLQKESEERPNDPISKNGLNAAMTVLQQEQEAIRMKKESNKYAKGGKLGTLYKGEGPYSQYLDLMPKAPKFNIEAPRFTPLTLNDGKFSDLKSPVGTTPREQNKSFVDFLIDRNKNNYKGFKSNNNTNTNTEEEGFEDNWLRKLPVWMSGVAVTNDLLGGNEPDYSNANIFARAIEGTNRPIRGRQIGNYLRYNPFDTNYYINTLNANTAAARRAAMNTSGGNRAAALAGMLAADYNHGNQLGALARQAEEYNLAQRQKVEEFNRGTNTTNAEMAMKADMANAEQAMQRARMYGSLAEYRDNILAANRAEKSANLTNFIQGLGDLGRELTDRDMLRWLADLGVLKYDASGKYTGNKKSNKTAKGGRINRKKRGGFTI